MAFAAFTPHTVVLDPAEIAVRLPATFTQSAMAQSPFLEPIPDAILSDATN
ncbi:hypothetical protein OHA98_31340 [Streptomyces sp. NBC_00654]|uniref:hypothetical protein n=1 Tax=Streptomyces sp. NBC_00654 TaxID=2975799 RepID=UPI00225A4C1A|nr:hypothetical protein [Streptomyces sp. NBC_00654]MCX4969172.1 hypothetical protein [Streptomyces sp. NBC_00654]